MEHAYGILLDERIKEAGLSQRQVATMSGVKQPYISQIVRGVKPPPSDDVSCALASAISTVTVEELRAAAADDRPVTVDVTAHPQPYKTLTLALTRRVERRDLTDEAMAQLLALLGDDEVAGEVTTDG